MLHPTLALRSVCDITPELLTGMGIRGLMLDIDNTLTTHDNPVPALGVQAWISQMKAGGIRLRLVSNNHSPRVEPFAKMLDIPCICDANKPLSGGYERALAAMQLRKDEAAAVGDQLYTDILGANLFGIRSFYVAPIEQESWKKQTFICVKRILEKPFLPKSFYKE